MKKQIIYLTINNISVYVPVGTTVMQASEKLGIVIPRFCYHDLLEVAGNCRMCLVEVEKSPKPQASCGLPVSNNIRIFTNTPLVKKARESVLEFLLVNHPLDCPICDQGGECDLQNQAIKHGSLDSRFYNLKRGVEDKDLGPVIQTVITRCIHCTRCVRFASEIAGVENIGTSLRGDKTEVGTYVKINFNSEVSGNVIDLCPVGALTLKNQAFKTRPWEVETIQSIDTTDSLGSNITIQCKYSRPVKVLPRFNKKINLEWLADKSRFAYEGHSHLRLADPYYSRNKKLHKISSWLKTKTLLNKVLQSHEQLNIIFGRNLDIESLKEGKELVRRIGGDCYSETDFNIFPSLPAYFQSTLSLDKIEQVDSCLLLGVNPRIEATLANLRLRSHFKKNTFTIKVYSLGNPVDLTYKVHSFGLQYLHLYNLVIGKHEESKISTKTPLLIYGDTLSRRKDATSALILAYTYKTLKKIINWLGCLRLPLGANSIAKSFTGLAKPKLKNYKEDSLKINYYYGIENTQLTKNSKTKIIVETTHVKATYKNACFILPQQSVLEKDGSFINFSGNIQKNLGVFRSGLKPLSLFKHFYKTYCNLFHEDKLKLLCINSSVSPNNIKTNTYYFDSYVSPTLQVTGQIFKNVKLYLSPLKALVGDIFCTDSATWASYTLAIVSENFKKIHSNFLSS